jgi:hypothetical protein
MVAKSVPVNGSSLLVLEWPLLVLGAMNHRFLSYLLDDVQ